MKLTKLILKEIIKEVISEADQKFYARDPKGKKISVFTNKDNFKKAVKGGYKKVDREEAEKELAGQGKAPDKPKAKPKIVADPFADKTADTNNTNNLAWLQPDWVQQHVKDYMLDDNQIAFGYDYDAGRAMIGALKNSGYKSGKDFELDYEMGDKPGRDNPSAIKILNPAMYQDDDLMQSMQNNLASDEDDYDDDDEDGPSADEDVSQAIYSSLEGIADAGEQGAGFDNPTVRKKVVNDFNSVKQAGGTVEDLAAVIKNDAEFSFPENLELADAAAQKVFGKPIPHGLSANDVGSEYMQDESIVQSLQKEFKQYDIINKNLTRG